MDWELIRKTYPNAWEKLEDFWPHHVYDEMEWVGDESINIRNLYDLFDGEGIRINVESMMSERALFRTIVYSLFVPSQFSYWYKSRTEAEEQAFLKAFEILNNKLEE